MTKTTATTPETTPEKTADATAATPTAAHGHEAKNAPETKDAPEAQPGPRTERMLASVALVGRTLASATAPARRLIAERRDLRTIAAGSTLILMSWLGAGGAGWQMPLVVAGLALIAIAIIGSRFSGTLTLSWSPDGISMDLSTGIAARAASNRALPTQAGGSDLSTPAISSQVEAAIPPSEIEGRAETIEIHAAEIRAALAAVPVGPGEAADQQSDGFREPGGPRAGSFPDPVQADQP